MRALRGISADKKECDCKKEQQAKKLFLEVFKKLKDELITQVFRKESEKLAQLLVDEDIRLCTPWYFLDESEESEE